MKRITLIVFLLSAYGLQAQNRPSIGDRLYFGGGGSLGGGTSIQGYRYFSISVNPLVGYKITSNWSAGVGINYTHVNYPDFKTNLSQYGVSPFTRYNFGKLFAYGEYQMISVPSFDNSTRKTYKRLPLGLGYSMPIGDKAAVNVMGLYDVMYNRATSVFPSPWVFRVYFTVGRLSF